MPVPIEGEHLPIEVSYNAELQSGKDPGEDNEHADELPLDSLYKNYLVVQTHSFTSCPGGWSQTIPQVKNPDVEVLGWRSYTLVCICEAGWPYCQIL